MEDHLKVEKSKKRALILTTVVSRPEAADGAALYAQTDADNDDECATAGAPAGPAAAGVRPGNGAWKPRAVAD